MWRNMKRTRDIEKGRMRIRIKCSAGEGGPTELEIRGSVKATDIDTLKHAIERFERRACMKCYLDMGKVEYLSPGAAAELIDLKSRIEERGDLFDVVDISREAEKIIRDIGFGNAFQSFYYA